MPLWVFSPVIMLALIAFFMWHYRACERETGSEMAARLRREVGTENMRALTDKKLLFRKDQ